MRGVDPVGSKPRRFSCYAWTGGSETAADSQLRAEFADLKAKGIDGLLYSMGRNPEPYRRVGGLAKEAGLEFHAWIPTLMQNGNPDLSPSLFAVNGRGESAFEKPAYVDHYKFLCPNRPDVQQYLEDLYVKVAEVPEVDGVHLDYIRFPDVILARGLWKKYGLVMDREVPQFDYCYCDRCVSDFEAQTGIAIRNEADPSRVGEWKQFRYGLITRLVNRLADAVHAQGKKITAAVFPGPNSTAPAIVRQKWDQWNLDAFFPMHYNDFYLEGTAWIGAMCREGVTALGNRKPLYSGLFICPAPEKKATEPDPENHGLAPGELEAAIRESIRNGSAGLCLFTPGRMTDEGWTVLRGAMSRHSASDYRLSSDRSGA